MYGVLDCNNFYASCERIFQPKLEKHPVVVLSNNDGCIISRTNEVKYLGVRMGDAAFKYKDLFERHNVQVFSANFPLYADISSRVMKTIQEFAPDVEIYSIDEAFFALPGYSNKQMHTQAAHLRQAVSKRIGMPVSIGIAATKTLAKLANELAKTETQHHGVYGLYNTDQIGRAAQQTVVGDIWGIGRRLEAFLNSCGIYNAYQLMQAEDEWIREHLTITGLKTVHELRGIPCIDLEVERPAKKSIISSKSFGSPVTSINHMREAVSTFTARAAEKLREEHEIASFITVAITTNYHKKQERQYADNTTVALAYPTQYTPALLEAAQRALECIFKTSYRYKKATIVLTGLVSEDTVQENLFHPSSASKEEQKLMKVIDSINHEWGSSTLQYASQGIQKKWRGKSEHRSPRYTTRWGELLRVQ